MHEQEPAADVEQVVARSRETIRQAFEEALTAIRTVADHQRRFDRANDLLQTIEKGAELASETRTEAIGSIWEEEELTYVALASRTNVSPQRAHQLVAASRKHRKEEP